MSHYSVRGSLRVALPAFGTLLPRHTVDRTDPARCPRGHRSAERKFGMTKNRIRATRLLHALSLSLAFQGTFVFSDAEGQDREKAPAAAVKDKGPGGPGLGEDATGDTLLKALRDGGVGAKIEALKTLSSRPRNWAKSDEISLEVLRSLGDADAHVQLAAIDAVISFGGGPIHSTRKILEHLIRRGNREVRRRVLGPDRLWRRRGGHPAGVRPRLLLPGRVGETRRPGAARLSA